MKEERGVLRGNAKLQTALSRAGERRAAEEDGIRREILGWRRG